MDINKYLKKLNIKFELVGDVFSFTLEDGTMKNIKQKDLEQYLFIKMIEYIKSE